MIVLQLILYCLLFTAMVKIAVIGGAVNGLYFYPKAVQERAIELGISDRATIDRRFKCFMTAFYIVMLAALVLIIGAWNGVTGFGEAYLQALLFLEVMNIYYSQSPHLAVYLWLPRLPFLGNSAFSDAHWGQSTSPDCWHNTHTG